MTDWLLILTGALVFFMQAGFAMVCAGAIRKKNVKNTVRCKISIAAVYAFRISPPLHRHFFFLTFYQMLKNLLDACGAGIAFYAVGYGIAYGHDGESNGSTFLGKCTFFLMNDESPSLFFFQYAFSATCVTIIAGTLAERCQISAYFTYSLYLTGFVFPVVAHFICTYFY